MARPVTAVEAAASEPVTLFESPAWLKAYGIQNLVMLSAAGAEAPGHRLLFERRGRHLVHLGRLLRFEAACLARTVEALLEQTGADFVVFEDIEVEGDLPVGFDRSTFRYQRNWQIVLNGPDADEYRMSGKRLRENRRQQRMLERDLGDVRMVIGDRPSRELMAALVGLHREKIESLGKKHGVDDDEFEHLVAITDEIGHGVFLLSGDRVIAGDVVCIAGRSAYGLIGGYDMAISQYSPGIITHRCSIDICRERGLFDFNLLWGDGDYKQRLGAKPRELMTLVARRSPGARFSPAYARAVGGYRWNDFKARVKPLVRRQAEG